MSHPRSFDTYDAEIPRADLRYETRQRLYEDGMREAEYAAMNLRREYANAGFDNVALAFYYLIEKIREALAS